MHDDSFPISCWARPVSGHATAAPLSSMMRRVMPPKADVARRHCWYTTPIYSITSSARASSEDGTSSPAPWQS